jgi:hypothetical protein
MLREARLRPEHAARYPYLEPARWEPAHILVEKITAYRMRAREGCLVSWNRVLDPEHFEFRGSSPRPEDRPPDHSRLTET